MATGRLRALTLVCAALGLLLAGGCMRVKQATPLRILFVGNSLTYYNDLPETFATLYRAAHPVRSIDVELIASGGASLRDHLRSGVLARTLSETKFDLVVLQDVGGWPLCPPGQAVCEDSPAALREAMALVKARGAHPLWYATWQWLPTAQRELITRNRELAELLSVPYADVGAAMQAIEGPVAVRLLRRDGHPAAMGTWLAAAALLSASGQGPLPANTPPRSCGQRWEGNGLKADRPASQQPLPPRECHQPTDADWQEIRAAIVLSIPTSQRWRHPRVAPPETPSTHAAGPLEPSPCRSKPH